MPTLKEIARTNVSFQIKCANGRTVLFEHKQLGEMTHILATFARKHWGRNIRWLGPMPKDYSDGDVIDLFYTATPNRYKVLHQNT